MGFGYPLGPGNRKRPKMGVATLYAFLIESLVSTREQKVPSLLIDRMPAVDGEFCLYFLIDF